LLGAARPCQRRSEGGLHVDFTLGPTGRASLLSPFPQLGDRGREVSAVAQDNSDRLVS
jgi:hypothetical protein